jgi:hypothetical protein
LVQVLRVLVVAGLIILALVAVEGLVVMLEFQVPHLPLALEVLTVAEVVGMETIMQLATLFLVLLVVPALYTEAYQL